MLQNMLKKEVNLNTRSQLSALIDHLNLVIIKITVYQKTFNLTYYNIVCFIIISIIYRQRWFFDTWVSGGATSNEKLLFLRSHSALFERMLNDEERMKLIHFRRFFHGIAQDEFMSRVNVARKRVSRLNRRETFATLDENGVPPPIKSSKER